MKHTNSLQKCILLMQHTIILVVVGVDTTSHFHDHWEDMWTRLASFLRPLGGRMDTTAIFFMSIWRLHKQDWRHFTTLGRPRGHDGRHVFVYREATTTHPVSFLRPQGGRVDTTGAIKRPLGGYVDTTGVISTTTGRTRGHDWYHSYDHGEAARTRLV